MIRNTFQDYGLGFRVPDFSGLAGVGSVIGGHYGQQARKELRDKLIKKKLFEQKYPGVDVIPGQPVLDTTVADQFIKPPEFTQGSSVMPSDPYFDKVNSQFGSQTDTSKGTGFKLAGLNISSDSQVDPMLANQYMEDLSNYEDRGMQTLPLTPGADASATEQEAYLNLLSSFDPTSYGKLVDADKAQELAEYEAEMGTYQSDVDAATLAEQKRYDEQKAMYDMGTAAGFTPGDVVKESVLSDLGEVDEGSALSELGYRTGKGATANFLMKQENRRKGNDAQAIADEAWKVMNSSPEGSKEHTEAAIALNTASRDFQQYTGKEYKAPSEFKREKAIGQEKRELTQVKNDLSKSIKDYTKAFIDTRKNVTKNFNEAAKNAKAFQAAHANAKGKEVVPVASYQAMLKAVNKMLEPNSAVMQGEADAFMGQDISNTIRGAVNSGYSGLQSILYNTGANSKNDFKPSSVSQSDVTELVNLYNSLIEPLDAGRKSIESGQGEYFTNIKSQLEAEYGDSIGSDELNELLDKKRFKSLLYGQMYIDELPGTISSSNNTNTDRKDVKDTPKPPPRPRPKQDWRVVNQGGRKYRVLYKNGKPTTTYKEIK